MTGSLGAGVHPSPLAWIHCMALGKSLPITQCQFPAWDNSDHRYRFIARRKAQERLQGTLQINVPYKCEKERVGPSLNSKALANKSLLRCLSCCPDCNFSLGKFNNKE